MEEDEALPDHLRCNRTDGRQWRCGRRIMENMKLCEIHYLQGRHRQNKHKVPDSLKIVRAKKNRQRNRSVKIEIRGKKKKEKVSKAEREEEKEEEEKEDDEEEDEEIPAKRKRVIGGSEALDEALKKMRLKRGDLQLELIREFLKRQVRKRKAREPNRGSEEELMRELPNGVMAISPSLAPQKLDNVGCFNVKLGLNSRYFTQRCFRSKNIEPIPIGAMQVMPLSKNVANSRKVKRNRCHWCKRSSYTSLIKCSNCQKQFFCVDCIRERDFDEKVVKMACPICCEDCSCRACLRNKSKGIEHKEVLKGKKKVDRCQLLHYLIYWLLPVLKEINRVQSAELETEAKIEGKPVSEVQLCRAELSCKKLYCCDKCKTSIVDFHRSCKVCSYTLCLKCFREVSQKSTPGDGKKFSSRCPDKLMPKAKQTNKPRRRSKNMHRASPMLIHNLKSCENGSISCPPENLGCCGNCILDLRSLFPMSWTKELEESAKETVCGFEFPDSSDTWSCCSVCKDRDREPDENRILPKVAQREERRDSFLFYPTCEDLLAENLEHFQNHWRIGHPVIVQTVLTTSKLSWDPVFMFCTYLEKSSVKCQAEQGTVKTASCSDWCEVELGVKKIFVGSLGEQTHANMWQQMLKMKCWLSSDIFQHKFPDHYAEIMRALPFGEYMNPVSGLLNLAAKLPREIPKPDLGPILYITYGGPDELTQADFQTKLCYDSYDVVNILAHATEDPISSEQLYKIKNLMESYNPQSNGATRNASDNHASKVKDLSLNRERTKELGLEDMFEKGLCLPNGTTEVFLGTETSIPCSGTSQCSEDSDQSFLEDDIEGLTCSEEKSDSDSCGAQWDIFRREDVPRLLEYLRRYSKEFSFAFCSSKNIVHPILDQSFFLDAFHKMRLKEEFDIVPLTFKQHIGEAVMIPAGCPYQIRKLKPSVNIIIDFISPESAAECIRLTDELRKLPSRHKAKGKMLEVPKMAIYGVDTAIKEIHRLQHDSSAR